MSGDDLARVLYLAILLASVGGYVLINARRNIGRTLQQVGIWALIFLGAIAVAGLWGDIRRAVVPGDAVMRGETLEVPVSPDGHFYLTAEVNGARIRFVVDTGASDIVLTQRDAERAGFNTATLNYFGSAMTANGRVATAPVTLDRFDLAGMTEARIPAVVNGGDLDTSLLGMTWLGRHEVTFSRDRMVIRR